jgi:Lanthionine synthetase C-like protein
MARAGAEWLAERALRDLEDVSLYQGLAGVVIAMHEAHHHFGDDRFGDAAVSGAEELAARVDYLDNSSLYFGLAGLGIALDALGDATAAARAFDPVRRRFDGQRWNEMYELLMGNGGIGLVLRWSNYEHRATPSVLEPRTGWAMGNAGIIRELLRYARLSRGAADSYAVRWPDHPTTSGTVGRDGDKVPRADVEGPSAVAPPSGGNSRPRSHRREAVR